MDNVNCGAVHNPIKGKWMVSFGRDGWIGFRQKTNKQTQTKNLRKMVQNNKKLYSVIHRTKAKWMVPFQRYGLGFRHAGKN